LHNYIIALTDASVDLFLENKKMKNKFYAIKNIINVLMGFVCFKNCKYGFISQSGV
jgi:hypothetical protein